MPNRNAYLAVCFNDATRSALQELQDALEEHLGREGYAFDRMDTQELHMTFFFAGEQLSQLKADALRAWHARLVATIQAAIAGEVTMRLSGISVFPPGKFNLLVARFDAPTKLHELQRLVKEGARTAGIASSGSQAESEGGAWVPHVTLGKVRASRAVVGTAAARAAEHAWQLCGQGVDEGLGAFAPMHGHLNALLVAPTDGLTLCGDQPKQAWLDWQETLRF